MDPSSVRVYRDGTVSYARRMNFDVACDMDFRLFPFNNQTCDIIMHSFAYTTDDYTLRWTRNDDGEVTSYVNDVINLAQWTFELSFDGEYDMEEIGNEVKPGLIARLTLQRLPYYPDIIGSPRQDSLCPRRQRMESNREDSECRCEHRLAGFDTPE